MSLKHYIGFMLLGTIICWVAWALVAGSTDPTHSPWYIFFFFYASLFLALVGSFSVIGFTASHIKHKQPSVLFAHVKKSFRQGILLAMIVVASLYMKAADMLTWWSALLLIFSLLVFESVFLSQAFGGKARSK